MADMPGLVWRRSSFSGGTDGTNCVEVARTWRKSSFSGAQDGTECVEVALPGDAAAVRDSKNPSGPALSLPRSAWVSLLGSISRP